jgi:hypothetical protein
VMRNRASDCRNLKRRRPPKDIFDAVFATVPVGVVADPTYMFSLQVHSGHFDQQLFRLPRDYPIFNSIAEWTI